MRYFVTGGSGFIGRRLIRALLASTDNIVYFLLREESRARLPALLAAWGEDARRAILVYGDVRQPGLGLGETERAALAGNIDHFFHLAAIYDLRADAASQMATNVEGTRHAVALASAIGAGCFHHMSSIAVAGLYEGTFREDMFEEAENLWHPYFATKHASEKVVRGECRMPWRVYRPGLVVGDSRSGETDKIDGPYYFFKLIQKVRRVLPPWLPTFGLEGGRINIVPVDYVVAAMCCIAHQPGLDGKAFHLTDPEAKRVGDVLGIFAQAAHAPPMSLRVNAALLGFLPDWLRQGLGALKPVRRLRDAVMRELGLPPGIMDLLNWPTRFDNRQAEAVLKPHHVACPRLESYAAPVWDYWERHLDPDLHVDRSLRSHVAGKVVLVTGGSSGIGLACAHKLAEAGATLLICGRNPDKLEAARLAIAEGGHAVQAYAVDLSDIPACERFIGQLLDQHGRVDILVNDAGRSIRRSVEESVERFHDFQRMMQLNYFGALRLTLGLLPAMAAQRGGHVINISSIGVLTNAPRFSAYLASKAALEAWTYSAAAEYADLGVKFTVINMPLVRTPMIAPTEAYRDAPALRPEEAAELVVRAIVNQPIRIATEVGLIGMGMQLAAPNLSQAVLNSAYRLSEPGALPAAGEAAPELKAMQQLLRGVHL